MSKYRYLVLTDLDGTLLNSKGSLSPETVDYVKKLNERDDILFAFSTGRGWEESHFIYKKLELKGFISCCNGSHIYDPHKEFHIYSFIAPTTWESILRNDSCFEHSKNGRVYSDKGVFNFVSSDERLALIEKLKDMKANVFNIKIYLNLKDDVDRELDLDHRLNFLKTFSSGLKVVLFRYFDMDTINLEIQSKLSSKEDTVKFFSNYYEVAPENIFTFGDQTNDLPAARGVSYFTAVKNAIDIVKQESNRISDFTNDESAVVKDLDNFLKKINFFV